MLRNGSLPLSAAQWGTERVAQAVFHVWETHALVASAHQLFIESLIHMQSSANAGKGVRAHGPVVSIELLSDEGKEPWVV